MYDSIALPTIEPGLIVSKFPAQPYPASAEVTMQSPLTTGPITLHGTRPISASYTTNCPSGATKPALYT